MSLHDQLTSYFLEFSTPDVEEKECIICMESFDIESGKKFISLPCECSSSIYHINCIVTWITSGTDKNYCPHCKKIFELPDIHHTQLNYTPINTSNIINRGNRTIRTMRTSTNPFNTSTNSRVITRTTRIIRPSRSSRTTRSMRATRLTETSNTDSLVQNRSSSPDLSELDDLGDLRIIRIPDMLTLNEDGEIEIEPIGNVIISIETSEETIQRENPYHENLHQGNSQGQNQLVQLVQRPNTLPGEEIFQRINNQKKEIRIESAIVKLTIHMALNTIINLINFTYICNFKTNFSQRILALIFFLKIFSNFIIVGNMNRNIDSINFKLFLSFIGQFISIMMTLMINNNLYKNPLLIYTQVGFICVDLILSAIISYYTTIKIQNVIYDLGVIEHPSQISN